jgi:hypothetical protein
MGLGSMHVSTPDATGLASTDVVEIRSDARYGVAV